jgi:Rrf2 family protein
MDRVVGISDRTNFAFHALALAAASGGSIAASTAAERLDVSPTYLAKILRALVAQGILESTRGIGGGFSLAKPPESIALMEVLEALDGPLPSRSCLFEKTVCDTGTCLFKVLCLDIEARLREALERTTLADLATNFSACVTLGDAVSEAASAALGGDASSGAVCSSNLAK